MLPAIVRRETIAGNNTFLLHVAVQSGLNHGRDNPLYESCVVKVATRDLREPDAVYLVFTPNGSFTQACVIDLRVMRHYTNNRTVIQITNKCTILALQCVHSHTCGTRTVVADCLIGGPNSLGGPSRKRGGNLAPYDYTWSQIPNRRV